MHEYAYMSYKRFTVTVRFRCCPFARKINALLTSFHNHFTSLCKLAAA